MLIDEPEVEAQDPILAMIAAMGSRPYAKRITTGVYEIGHFGSSAFLSGYEHYPEFEDRGPYGVCDNGEQLLKAYPELVAPGRSFVVTLVRIRKADEEDSGGWRWHKWG